MAKPKYEDLAQDPVAWRDMAQIHRITADHVWEHFWLTVRDVEPARDREKLLAFLRAYELHAGLALEVASKAVLVKRNPKVVVGGELKVPGGHNLLVLVPGALKQKLTVAEKDLLQRYTHAVRWFARYPVPLKELVYEKAPPQGISDDDRVLFNGLMDRLLKLSK